MHNKQVKKAKNTRSDSMETKKLRPKKQASDLKHSGKGFLTSFFVPEQFLPKDKRREIIDSLIGSIDDPTMAEPVEVEIESRRDWELID